MHSSCSLPALLLLPPLLLVATTGPARALTEDEQRAMVELHNLYRAQVSPPASDMRRMVSAAGGQGPPPAAPLTPIPMLKLATPETCLLGQ